jgi:hypothetical protein
MGDREQRLEELVRWLALPYGRNRPTFPHSDHRGAPMPHSIAMEALYAEVVNVPLCHICNYRIAMAGYRVCGWCDEMVPSASSTVPSLAGGAGAPLFSPDPASVIYDRRRFRFWRR